jgi:hypothetical protein
MDSIMELTYVAAVANMIILLALLYPGFRNLFKTRSAISAALLLFTLLFLIQNAVAIYFHLTVSYTPAVEFEVATLTIIQVLGFGSLLWATYK